MWRCAALAITIPRMALNPATATGINLSLTLAQAIVAPLRDANSQAIPVAFNGLTYVKQVQGTYIPADDIATLRTFDDGENPTWVLIVVDGQANLNFELSGGGNAVSELPITKVFFTTITALSPVAAAVIFDGRTNVAQPMAQGTPVNWALFYGDGSVG